MSSNLFQGARVDLEGEIYLNKIFQDCKVFKEVVSLKSLKFLIISSQLQLQLLHLPTHSSQLGTGLEEDDIKFLAVRRIFLLGMNKVDKVDRD